MSKPLLWKGGGELLEMSRRLIALDINAIHLSNAIYRKVFILVLRGTGDPGNSVAGTQAKLTDQEKRNKNILGKRGKAVFGITDKAEVRNADLKDAIDKYTCAVIRHPRKHIVD